MSQQLILEISDEVYAIFQQQASAVGLSVSDWLITLGRKRYESLTVKDLDPQVGQQARQRLLSYAGVISLGHATGIQNEDIDADLVKAYANEF